MAGRVTLEVGQQDETFNEEPASFVEAYFTSPPESTDSRRELIYLGHNSAISKSSL